MSGRRVASSNTADSLCPYQTVPAENAEDGLLRGTPASPCAGIPYHLSFIPPYSSKVGFIHLHRTGEDLGHVLGEDHPDLCECPEHSLLIKSGLFNDGVRALLHQEQVEDLPPFLPRKPERDSMGSEVLCALSAPSSTRTHFV